MPPFIFFCDIFVWCHPILLIFGRNIPQSFLRHTDYSTLSVMESPHKIPVGTSDNYQVTLTVIRKNTVHYQSKCSKFRPSVLTQAHSRPRHLVDDMLLQTTRSTPCSNQAPLQQRQVWATLGTFPLIIWTVFLYITDLLLMLLDSYLTWQLDFYVETSKLTLYCIESFHSIGLHNVVYLGVVQA